MDTHHPAPGLPQDTVSATAPDWPREASRALPLRTRGLLRAMRGFQGARGPLRRPVKAMWLLLHRMWSVLSQADISITAQIGGGLMLPHPNGIVIHKDAVIGPNCLIFQQVTIGTNGKGVPVIGGHVDIGAGARIIGPVTIGDHARIGANAVVICDVPARRTAVGVPARVV